MRPYFLKMVWERELNPFQTCDALPDIKITLDHEPPPHITKLIVSATRCASQILKWTC